MLRIPVRTVLLLLSIVATPVAFAAEVMKDGKPVDVPVCGGFVGIPCKANEWCDYPRGYACGAGDQFGICRPRPQACPFIFRPVCGCDGKTYSNDCTAHAAGVSVHYEGPCRENKPELRAN